jgi:glutathione S-transferase
MRITWLALIELPGLRTSPGVRVCRATAATFDQAHEQFGETGVAELIALCGFYTLVSMSLNGFDVELPEGAEYPLKPTDAAGRHAMRTWTQRFDAFHQHAGALTYAIGIGPMVLQQGPEAIAAQLDGMPDAAKREQKRVVIEQGVKAPSVAVAVHAVVRILDQMQFDLSSHAWLAGGDLSLADLAALPYVLRLDSLAMTPLLEARPEVAAWFTRMQARPSYEVAIKSQVPEIVIALLRKNGQAVWENVAALAN